MSDIPIPGVSNQYNTSKIISDAMKLERIPLTRLQDREATLKKQREAWLDINRTISTVRDASQTLYSFTNPFEDKVATTTNPSVLTATATRKAQIGTQKITIEKIAQADAFLSTPLPSDFTVPPGDYGFAIGKKELSFQWGGGRLTDFAQFINQRSQGLLDASVINDTPTTQVFLIKSKLTGAQNALKFTKDSINFGLTAGLLVKTGFGERALPLSPTAVQPWTKPLAPESYSVSEGIITLKPGAELSVPVAPPVAAQKGLVLELTVSVRDLPQGVGTQAAAPTGPTIPPTGEIDYQGIKIQSSPSAAGLPPWSPPTPPPVVSDLGVLYLKDGAKSIKLPDLKDAQGPQVVQIPLTDYVQSLEAVEARNLNTYREIQISGIRIYNPNARGEYSPVHAISQASDAVVDLDGVKATRASNTIDDLIPGVTLNLQAPSPAPVTLDVGPNKKKIKDAIISFVGDYNNLLANLEVYTSRDPAVIDEITYYTPEQRKAAHEKLGLFMGDFTLSEMKSRLQEIMMNPYKTSAGRDLALLAQIGISTNTVHAYTGYDAAKLRGYLDIDETKLDQALASELTPVKDLFGYASGGDLIINTGVAYTVDQFLKGFNSVGGIIPMRTASLDQSISQTKQDITTMQQQLAEKEQSLKDKYGQMQGAIDSLQQSSKAIQSLGGGGQSTPGQ